MRYFFVIAVTVFLMPLYIHGQEDKLTVVPDVEFAEKNEKVLFYNWTGAKDNYKWVGLETDKEHIYVYRYFSKQNDLMVVQKSEGFLWTHADLPYAPFPPFWYYELSFTSLEDDTSFTSTGLLLKATSNKEEIIIIFTANPANQTYYFGLYNAVSKTWRTLNTLVNKSKYNSSDAISQKGRNKLKIERSGNKFLLYINNKLVETVKVVQPNSELNKLHGIGVAGEGKHGYYVDNIKFSIFTDEGIYNNKPTVNPPAAPPISKALNKKAPVKIFLLYTSLLHDLDANGIQRAKNAMVGENKFSEKEFDSIVSRANINNYPLEINTVDKIQYFNNDRIEKGQCYIQGSFLVPFNGGAQIVDLVWMPVSDNQHLDKTLMPADGGDQFYFVTHRGTSPSRGVNYYSLPNRMSNDAELAMKQKNNRSIIESPVGSFLNTYGGFHSYKPLRDLGYTEQEFVRIMQLSTYPECQPVGVQYGPEYQQSLYNSYKAYRITEFNDGSSVVRLYWVPTEENLSLPKAMHPKTEEGLFMFTWVKNVDTDLEVSRKVYANKPTGQYIYRKPTEYISAKTSTWSGNGGYSNNEGNGSVAQKNNKPKQPEYGKFSPDDVYKEEEKLINYLKNSDYQLNPYLDKILRSGNDAWILYKTRESARRLVDGQISAINAFLKDYEPYTSSSFKSDIEGRLATAIGVRGRLN